MFMIAIGIIMIALNSIAWEISSVSYLKCGEIFFKINQLKIFYSDKNDRKKNNFYIWMAKIDQIKRFTSKREWWVIFWEILTTEILWVVNKNAKG